MVEAKAKLCCPECGSTKLYKDGLRYLKDGSTIQRVLCRDCGYRFSPNNNAKPFYRPSSIGSNRQVRATSLPGRVINLAKVEPPKEGPAGATTDTKGKIIDFLWKLKKEGYKESTIKQKHDILKRLINLGADLNSQDSVKEVIALLDRSESYKLLMCLAYEGFARHHAICWTRPNYKQTDKLPFIPYESEIDSLIAGCGRKTAAFLQLLKETAMRLGEGWKLQWTDLDVKNNVVTCNNPEKNSRARIFKISNNLSAMLNQLKKRNNHVFGGVGIASIKNSFQKQRRTIAYKLQNPRLLKITLHTLRHWKATQLYHQTKDILYVMKFLGHKNIKNTLVYIDLEVACFPSAADEYHSKVAKTEKEICDLIESGFEYVCDFGDAKIFRKRK